MFSTRARWALVALFVVVVAGCSGGEASETSAAPAPSTTTTAAPTTTVAPVTTTSLPPTTTTDDGLVGDPEALRESFEELERLIAADITYDEPRADPRSDQPRSGGGPCRGVPLRSLADGERPARVLGRGIQLPGEPRFRSVGSDMDPSGSITDTRFSGIVDTYEFVSGEVVPIDRGASLERRISSQPCRMGASPWRSPTRADRIRGQRQRPARFWRTSAAGRERRGRALPHATRLDAVQRGARRSVGRLMRSRSTCVALASRAIALPAAQRHDSRYGATCSRGRDRARSTPTGSKESCWSTAVELVPKRRSNGWSNVRSIHAVDQPLPRRSPLDQPA